MVVASLITCFLPVRMCKTMGNLKVYGDKGKIRALDWLGMRKISALGNSKNRKIRALENVKSKNFVCISHRKQVTLS